jgi:molecular chaperone GrpE
MPPSEETGSGPIIHDNRRIDPVTGQVRGKHAASKPAGTTGAGRPAGGSGTGATGASGAAAGSGGAGPSKGAPAAADAKNGEDEAKRAEGSKGAKGAEGAEPAEAGEVLEGTVEEAPAAGQPSDAAARLAERTADLQRLQAEYANYRKRVDRDRAAVREQAVATALTGLLPVLDAIDQAGEHGELSGGFKSVADSLAAALGKLGLVAYGEKGDTFDPKIHEALTHTYSPDVTEDACVEIFQPGYKVGDRILRPARVAVAAPATGPDGSSNEAGWPTGEDGN